MNTELKVVMFTDQVESTSNMAKRTHSETLQVTYRTGETHKGGRAPVSIFNRARRARRHYPERKRWLVEHDVLNEAGEFAVPLVKQWVRKTQITNS